MPATLSDQLIISYNFNVPNIAISNSGSLGASFDVTATVSSTSAYPAKNRGLHFDGTNAGVIVMPPLLLSHTFSIHSWILSYSEYGSLFSKKKWIDPDTETKFSINLNWDWDDEEYVIESKYCIGDD